MTQEDKELLLKDLSARLLYGVKCKDQYGDYINVNIYNAHIEHLIDQIVSGVVQMVLRSMSSMTEEERDFANNEFFKNSDNFQIDDVGEMYTESQPFESVYTLSLKIQSKYLDWLNAHHFDYRGLIEKGLALEAPEGMYNIKEK